MYSITDDALSRTRYVVFGSTVYVDRRRLPAVVMVQDDTCDYAPEILRKFVESLK